MSKGSGAMNPKYLNMLPSAWYNVSTKLKDIVKRLEVKLSGAMAHDLYEYLYSGDYMLWARSVMSEYTETGTCYLLAWIGALRNRDIYWGIVDDIRPIIHAISNQNILVN